MCVRALIVGQTLETPCSSYVSLYVFKYEFVLMGSKGLVTQK